VRDYVPQPPDLHRASRTSAPATPTRSLAAHTRSPRWLDSSTSSTVTSTSPALGSYPIHSPRASLGPQSAPLIVTPRVTSHSYGSPRDGGVGGGEGGRGKGGGSSSSRGSDAGGGLSPSSFDASGALRPVAAQAPDSPPISNPHLSPHPTGSKRGVGQRHSPHRGSGGSSPTESAVLASRLEQGLRSLTQSPLFLSRARP
jgi:hypothetical protein